MQILFPHVRFAPRTHLLEQDVSEALHQVVPVSGRLRRAEPPLLHGAEEGAVEGEQLVQAGEDPLHRLHVQLHLPLHAPAEHLGHDVERLQVVQLRLHQLCGDTTRDGKPSEKTPGGGAPEGNAVRSAKGRRPLTVDDVLPLHGPFVLLLAELVLHGEAPRLGLVVGSVGRQVAEDARVHAVCWGGYKPGKAFVSPWALKTEIIFSISRRACSLVMS